MNDPRKKIKSPVHAINETSVVDTRRLGVNFKDLFLFFLLQLILYSLLVLYISIGWKYVEILNAEPSILINKITNATLTPLIVTWSTK